MFEGIGKNLFSKLERAANALLTESESAKDSAPQRTTMKTTTSALARVLLVLAVISLSPVSQLCPAATLSWSGGGGANANWDNGANWGFAGTPASGDTLVFPAGQPNLNNTNNIPGLVLSQMRFAGAGGGYVIRGNALTVTNNIEGTNTVGLNTVQLNIALGAPSFTINVGSGASLTLGGVLSGSASVTKPGLGTLTYSGSANTYTGPTVALEGTLELGKGGSALSSTLQVGDSTHSATVRYLSDNQIPNNSTVTLYNGSVLDLNNFFDDLGTLNLHNNTTVNMGTGFLDFRVPNSINVISGFATINGRIGLPTGNITVDVPEMAVLTVNATITGGNGFFKSGPGMMHLISSNSYSGPTVVQAGWLRLQNGNALGSTAAGTVVSNLASLVLDLPFGVTNEALTLNGYGVNSSWGALDTESAGTNYWTGPITLNAESTIAPYGGTRVLRISGVISGPGGFILGTQAGNGGGILYLDGAAANTYGGDTIVNSGTLLLNKNTFDGAVPGDLIVGNGAGVDVVRLLQLNQIANTALVTINAGGLLDLNNLLEGVGSLDMTAGTAQSGSSTLVLFGNKVTTHAAAASSTISGTLELAGGATTFEVANGAVVSDLLVSAAVEGAVAVIKNGNGALQLSAANAYSGLTTISNGFILISNPLGLGTAAAGTVLSGGNLSIVGASVTGESLTNNSTASILQASGASGWGSNVVLNAELEVQVIGGGTFDISGAISGVGALTKSVTGTLRFSGPPANTYSGTTIVEAGTLELSKPSGTRALAGNLVVGDGLGGVNADVVRLLVDNQISDSTDVVVSRSGLFDLGIEWDVIDELSGTGNVTFGVAGWIEVGAANGSSTFSGIASGPGFDGGYTLRKLGTGTFTLTGDNTYLNQTRVDNGTLIVNGSQPQSPLFVGANAATAGGTGVVGVVRGVGNLAPGNSPGLLTSSNLSFNSTADYFVELTGPNPGTDYDQLNVRGTNTLGNATLHVTAAFTTPVAVGQRFTIINNDLSDPITGTFNGLAEGASLTAGFYAFTISYADGTGNDVVLTLTNVPGAAVGNLTGVTSGNGNGAIDPNECNLLSVVLTNQTGTPMTGISATLASVTPGVLVTEMIAPFPDAAGNGTSTNSLGFQISTTTNFVCGTGINLLLAVTTASHGAFVVPVVIGSGATAALPIRFDNNTVTNVPDIGVIESTNTVAAWSGPVAKIAVSLWLVAPFSSDVTLTLIAPNGNSVELSSGNGAGANYGSGSADAARTIFDDAAAVSITAGASPFVGTFRPEGSLASLLAGNPVGNWRLRIDDAFGSGSPDTLRAWSLFLYPAECTPGSGQCELCPDVVLTSAMGPNSPMYSTGYLSPNSVPSACGVAKACPGTSPGTYPTQSFRFQNGPSDACITVTLEHTNIAYAMVAEAYTAAFNPTNADKCASYLADAGFVVNPGVPRSFSFAVTSNATFVVNLVSGGYGPYKLTVSGGDCRPVLNITPTSGTQAVLDWTTAAPGYQLEHTNSLASGAPVWPAVVGEPVIVGGRYTVTNQITGTNQFYRLRKPVTPEL